MTLSKANKETVNKIVSNLSKFRAGYPESFKAIDELASWSINNFKGTDPWGLYLDLIGYSEEAFGCSCCCIDPYSFSKVLGYHELCLLGDALKVFENHGNEIVFDYITTIGNEM